MGHPSRQDLLILAASHGENLKLAQRFLSAAVDLGVSASLIDLTTLNLPLFTPQAQAAGPPTALEALAEQLEGASHWVICTPEYNASIPPVLTSAVAWLSVHSSDFRALFDNRPIAIATHSGSGGTTVLTALRLQLVYLGANVLGRQLLSNEFRPVHQETVVEILQRLLRLPAASL